MSQDPLPSSSAEKAVLVNDQPRTTASRFLADFLAELGYPKTSAVAVAVQDEVVPRAEWETFQLHPQQRITILRAAQGG